MDPHYHLSVRLLIISVLFQKKDFYVTVALFYIALYNNRRANLADFLKRRIGCLIGQWEFMIERIYFEWKGILR